MNSLYLYFYICLLTLTQTTFENLCCVFPMYAVLSVAYFEVDTELRIFTVIKILMSKHMQVQLIPNQNI
jgi:hypothetical protein